MAKIKVEIYTGEVITISGRKKHLKYFLETLRVACYDAAYYNKEYGYKNAAEDFIKIAKKLRERDEIQSENME